MNIQHYTQPRELEKYSFMWSEARLVIASVALFIGGRPPVVAFNPISALYGPISSLLQLAWIISGLASAYLFYRWYSGDGKLFGKNEQTDKYAFFVSIVSGINLGLTGLLGNNIGMSISSNHVIFAIVGILYLVTAWHLWQRWNSSGGKIF